METSMFWLVVACVLVALLHVAESGGGKSCWIKSPNKHLPGLSWVNKHTLNGCKEWCQRKPGCHAIDFDTRRKFYLCWAQKKPLKVGVEKLRNMTGVTNYILKERCGARSCWIKSPNHQIIGLSQVAINSEVACKHWCALSSTCHVVDFDVNSSPKCWAQKTQMDVELDKLKPKTGVTDFILKDFCKVRMCWQEMHGTQYEGLVEFQANNVAGCRHKCLNTPYCRLFNFAPDYDQKCFIQSKRGLEKSKFNANSEVNTYILKPACKDRFCWTRHMNIHVTNLQVEAKAKSISKCKVACFHHPHCRVIGFKSRKCWIHKTGVAKRVRNRNSPLFFFLRKSCKP